MWYVSGDGGPFVGSPVAMVVSSISSVGMPLEVDEE
jgi:hypothetical protein